MNQPDALRNLWDMATKQRISDVAAAANEIQEANPDMTRTAALAIAERLVPHPFPGAS